MTTKIKKIAALDLALLQFVIPPSS